jgi:hypothetical protein
MCIPKSWEINSQLAEYQVQHNTENKCFDVSLLNNMEFIFLEDNQPLQIELKNFLNENHLQNNCRGQEIRLGLFYNGELVQIITFGKSRYNKKYQYELLRLCTKKDKIIIGGSNKLFSYFIDNYNPESIISYCDISKFSGNVYQKLGFYKKQINLPTCHYVNLKTKQHISISLLNKLGFDKIFKTEYGKNTSNIELIKKHKFVQVYDCGQAVYIWKKTAK